MMALINKLKFAALMIPFLAISASASHGSITIKVTGNLNVRSSGAFSGRGNVIGALNSRSAAVELAEPYDKYPKYVVINYKKANGQTTRAYIWKQFTQQGAGTAARPVAVNPATAAGAPPAADATVEGETPEQDGDIPLPKPRTQPLAQQPPAAQQPPQQTPEEDGPSVSSGSSSTLGSPLCGCAQCSVNSGFGPRIHPIFKTPQGLHTGCDVRTGHGSAGNIPIRAAADGVVSFASWAGGYGNYLEIKHTGGLKDLNGRVRNGNNNNIYYTSYGHLQKILVANGTRVRKGQVVGIVNSTGRSTGNHLHFEVKMLPITAGRKVNKQYQNPLQFVNLGAGARAACSTGDLPGDGARTER